VAKATAKISKKKKVETPVIEPKVVREVEEAEVVESTEGTDEVVFTPSDSVLFTVKIDNKKFDNRDLHQVHSLLHGVAGDFKKLTIELKK
jgi:hypothetical protein